MRRFSTGAVFALMVLGGLSAPAQAASGGCGEESKEACNTGETTNEGFKVTGERTDKRTKGVTQPVGGAAGPTVRRQTRYAPTCTGNSYDDPGALCNAAVETCDSANAEVRFWVWSRTLDETANTWSPWRLVDTVCLGPDDPAIDPAVAVPATVQREFTSVVVLKGRAEVSPEPDTLVNLPTVFTTDAPASYDIPLTLLGQSVVITATARRYTWHFGDGQSATSAAAKGWVEHRYGRAETFGAHVVIEWSGTFRVNGGGSQPIAGTATTTGLPTQVTVKQARAELVRD